MAYFGNRVDACYGGYGAIGSLSYDRVTGNARMREFRGTVITYKCLGIYMKSESSSIIFFKRDDDPYIPRVWELPNSNLLQTETASYTFYKLNYNAQSIAIDRMVYIELIKGWITYVLTSTFDTGGYKHSYFDTNSGDQFCDSSLTKALLGGSVTSYITTVEVSFLVSGKGPDEVNQSNNIFNMPISDMSISAKAANPCTT